MKHSPPSEVTSRRFPSTLGYFDVFGLHWRRNLKSKRYLPFSLSFFYSLHLSLSRYRCNLSKDTPRHSEALYTYPAFRLQASTAQSSITVSERPSFLSARSSTFQASTETKSPLLVLVHLRNTMLRQRVYTNIIHKRACARVYFLIASIALAAKGVVKRDRAHANSGISVCIPAIARDLDKFNEHNFERTLGSIRSQTRPPLEVIVALSEATYWQSQFFLTKFQKLIYPVPLVFLHMESRGSVGTNRNRAGEAAHGAILSFFDADGDVMHPQRLEAIEEGFLRFPKTRIFLHSYTKLTSGEQLNISKFVESPSLCRMNLQRRGHEWILPEIHHGHMSVSASTFARKKFSTDFEGHEDSTYVNTLLSEQPSCENSDSVIFLNATLTLHYLARSQKVV